MLTHPKATENNAVRSPSLVGYFASMTDPRINRRKAHELVDILVIAICTMLCGGEGFNDME